MLSVYTFPLTTIHSFLKTIALKTHFIIVKGCHFNIEKAIVIMSFAAELNSPICSDTFLLSNLKLEMRLQSPTSVVTWQCFFGSLERNQNITLFALQCDVF